MVSSGASSRLWRIASATAAGLFVVSLRQKQRLAESFVNLMDSLHRSVVSLKNNGMATRSDVLTVEVKVNEAQIALTKVTNGLSLARMALAQVCGLPVDTRMTLADEELQAIPAQPHVILALPL